MKKRILILILVILSVFLLLVGCSNSKQNNKSVENTDIDTIKIGKYIGEPYKLTSSFIPILTFENSNKFKFELGISKSIEGTYTTDNNKLVLTSTDGGESYMLGITKNTLIIEQEIPNYVKKNTKFKLLE